MNSLLAFQGKNKNSGLTLIEILIVIGIVAFVMAISTVVDVNFYTRELSASEVSVLVSTLQKARSRAMNNIDAVPHGVHWDADEDTYVLFQGTSYDPGDSENEHIPRNPNIDPSGSFDEVYFEQLTGNPSETGDITLSDGLLTKVITLEASGLINW